MMVLAAGLFMVVLIAMAVLVDVGWWLRAKRDAQNDADAMVLAGAQDVEPCGGSDELALAAAMDWGDRNNVDGSDVAALNLDSVLNQHDAVYAKLSRDVDTIFGRILGFDQVTVSVEAEALCSFARMAQGLRPWAVQEEPSPPQVDEPCFGDVSGSHYGGSSHHEPVWGQSCILTFNGGKAGLGNFGPVDIEVKGARPGCTQQSEQGGAEGYQDAIVCGSITTYCVYEETPACPNYVIPSEPGEMGNPTRVGIQELLSAEPVCGDPNGNGKDDFEEAFDLSGPIPVATCIAPRVIPIFIIRDFQDADEGPKGYYIHHFVALYLEGCLLNDEARTLDPNCDDQSNFKAPGKTQVRVRFGELMDSSRMGGGERAGYINVVNLIK